MFDLISVKTNDYGETLAILLEDGIGYSFWFRPEDGSVISRAQVLPYDKSELLELIL